jgi:hypothetical protein
VNQRRFALLHDQAVLRQRMMAGALELRREKHLAGTDRVGRIDDDDIK